MQVFYYGVVESRDDPLRLGRCQVRVIGLHSADKTRLPTKDLPWAWPVQDITSAALSGIGRSATGLIEGSTVVVYFADESQQIPMIVGSLAGIPGSNELSDIDTSSTIQQEAAITPPATPPSNQVQLTNGKVVDPASVTSNDTVVGIVEPGYIGTLTNSQVTRLKAEIAKYESGNSYSKVNSIGYLGKYQFGTPFLEDMGYILKGATARNGTVKVTAENPDNWTGKNGVTNQSIFLLRSDVQEELMDAMLKRNFKILCKCDALSIVSPPEKVAGALMAAHLKGAGGARDYIKRGINSQDAYGTSCEKYYRIGYNVITGKETVEAPTPENINKPAVDANLGTRVSKYEYPASRATTPADLTGFADPNGHYPLEGHKGEPDTPRLSSVQKVTQTIVGEKESDLTKNIPIANSSKVWNQSPVPYNAKYPYNHAFVSESGHVLEFDDTRGAERVNLHHVAGTFIEIDALGNRVDKVKGIRTIIIEEDELVNIQGSGHVSITGDMSVRVGGECQIHVVGNANIKVDGNMHHEVTGAYSISAASFNVETLGVMNFKAAGNFNADAPQIWMNSGKSTGVTALAPYTPTIKIPAPFTREEEMALNMEDDTSQEAQKITAQSAASEQPSPPVSSDTGVVIPKSAVSAECDWNAPIDINTRLSANYTIKDLCKDGAYPTNGNNGLSAEQIACNMKQLALNVIEPLREKYADKGFKINSCYRGKTGKSQHNIGCAVDIGFMKIRGSSTDRAQYYAIAQEIKALVPFDQLLLEYRSNGSVWIHISFVPTNRRNMILTLNNDKTLGNGLIQLPQVG